MRTVHNLKKSGHFAYGKEDIEESPRRPDAYVGGRFVYIDRKAVNVGVRRHRHAVRESALGNWAVAIES